MERAIEQLRRCVSPAGFVAAPQPQANYRRIWSRDGCVCGLAALLSGEPELVAAFRRTLETLAAQQGPSGQLPSNVASDGSSVSYGGKAGRVDATIWYLLGTCLYGRLSGDDALVETHWGGLMRAQVLLRAWEYNDGGLLYVPQGGDWADEYVLSGYLLYDQVLRWWAQRELEAAGRRLSRSVDHGRDELPALIERHYASDRDVGSTARRAAFFLAGFRAGGVFEQFDAWGNALCCLLGVGSEGLRRRSSEHAAGLSRFDLVPAFDPPITPDDAAYAELCHAAGERFRNRPGRYHNGGLWPLVTGFWALAARRLGLAEQAARWAGGIARANRLGEQGFPEYLDAQTGEPGGVSGLGWSAAAEVLAATDPAVFLLEEVVHR